MKTPPVPATGFRATLSTLDHFWFDHGSATSLGLFRIFIGILSFFNFFLLALHWESWYSEKGYVPAWMGQLWLSPSVTVWWGNVRVPRIDLLNGVTDSRIAIGFFILIGVFSVTTTLGVWTRFSTIALAVGIVSLHHRNAVILHGGDTVLRICCIYLAVAPCGKACSLDRLVGLWRGKIAPGPALVSLWSQRLICFNVALIYFTTCWLKFDGAFWREGIATYFTPRLAEFYRFPVPSFMNSFPMVWISTYGTLAVEFSLGTLVFFRPLRKYVLFAGVGMHLYIDYSMNIPLFSYLMCATYICFFEGEEVAAWAKRVGERLATRRVTIVLPSGMRLKSGPRALLDAVDPLALVTYRESAPPLPLNVSAAAEWTATRADGTPCPPFFASWARSVGAYVWGGFPGVWPRVLRQSIEPAEILLEEPIANPPKELSVPSTRRKR